MRSVASLFTHLKLSVVANCIFGNWLGNGDTDTFLGLKSFWINKGDRTVKISVVCRTLGREIPAVPGESMKNVPIQERSP